MQPKTVVIHQPDFLPYLGFFQRFLSADLYVVLDQVQFLNNSKSWHNRDKIKTPTGEAWLTVSVQRAPRGTRINEVLLADAVDWRRKNLNLIFQNYRKAPFIDEIYPLIEQLYAASEGRLADFNLRSIRLLQELFDLQIETVLASELKPEGKSNDLLVDILQKVGATRYLSGLGARAYFDPEPYRRAGVEVAWQDFQHPVYPQLHGSFVPFLSSIDLLFNCGMEESRLILRKTLKGAAY